MPNRDSELERARAARIAAEAERDRARAEAAALRATIAGRTPRVESVVTYLAERQRLNHFGQDFDLTLVPRRRSRAT